MEELNLKEESSKDDLIGYSNWELIKDIAFFIKPYKWRFIFASFARFVSDMAGLFPVYALALTVTFFSKYVPGESLKYFWIILSLWIAASFVKYIGRFLSKLYGYRISERVSLDAQIKMISHFFALDIGWHEKENAGNKLKRIQKGGEGLERILRMWLQNFIEIGINLVGIIFILSRFDRIVGLITLVFLATYFFISFSLLKRAVAISQQVDIMEEGVAGLMFQAINNIRSVKVLGMAEKILKKIESKTGETFTKIILRVSRFQNRAFILNVWAIMFRLGIIVLIAYGIANRLYDVGFLVLFNGYFNNIVDSVEELSETTQDFIICKYGIARMQRTLEEPVRIDDEGGKIAFPKNWEKIKVKNLSFAYGKHQVLNNISFEIKRGERIGIIGLSGAGKSTLLKLLLKESENYCGDILFDDLSIRKIKKKSYLQNAGVVLQDTEVFNFTLRDNITIASPKKASETELQRSLDVAHVSDFMHKLPFGLDTYIGEKGVKLSGGEKQRLGIARAVYKKPEILFLDEATSHLDLESEEKIKDSLHTFFQKVTAIVIAHRLTTIREMDKILVIEKGKAIEFGTFDELYVAKGRLFELWEKQKF